MNLNRFEPSPEAKPQESLEMNAGTAGEKLRDSSREDVVLKSSGSIDLSQVKDPAEIKNIEWGDDFSGSMALNVLASAKGVRFPKRFRGRLILRSLESAEGLVLPEDFEGTLDLGELPSIDFLNLPERFKGDIYLRNVNSLKGLYVPPGFDGTIFISASVPQEELSSSEIATQGRVQFISPGESKVATKQELRPEATFGELSEALRKNLRRAIERAMGSKKK